MDKIKIIKIETLLFISVILLSLFLRLKIIFDLPLGTNTTPYGLMGFDDEPAHLNYTRFLLDHNLLPVLRTKITDPDAFKTNEFEYYQPPLYYWFSAVICRIFSWEAPPTILLTGRILNLILFMLSLRILFKIFKKAGWPNHLIYTALSAYALLGSCVYQFSLFSNDGLCWLLLWMIFYDIIDGLNRNWIRLICMNTLCHYTKFSVIVMMPLLVCAAIPAVRESRDTRTRMKAAAVLFLPWILSMPWYMRNLSLYGRPFGIDTAAGEPWTFVSSLKDSLESIMHMPYSFFFRFYFDPPKSILSWMNPVQYLWGAAAVIIWMLKLGQKIKKKTLTILVRTQEGPKEGWFGLLLISTGIAYIGYAIPNAYTEGRLLYPAMPGILYILTDCLYPDQLQTRIPDYFPILFVMLILLPPYVVAFL